jgi:hypothetical protein
VSACQGRHRERERESRCGWQLACHYAVIEMSRQGDNVSSIHLTDALKRFSHNAESGSWCARLSLSFIGSEFLLAPNQSRVK